MANRPKLEPSKCVICHIPFSARPKDKKRGFGRTCSPKCKGTYGIALKMARKGRFLKSPTLLKGWLNHKTALSAVSVP